MKIRVTVTDHLEETRSGKGRMQAIGIHAGSAFPLEHAVYIDNQDSPLKPGDYTAEVRLKRKGYELVVDFGARDLVPLVAAKTA